MLIAETARSHAIGRQQEARNFKAAAGQDDDLGLSEISGVPALDPVIVG